MKQCSKCGKENYDDSLFCSKCGDELIGINNTVVDYNTSEQKSNKIIPKKKKNSSPYLRYWLYSIPVIFLFTLLMKQFLPVDIGKTGSIYIPKSIIGKYFSCRPEYDYLEINSNGSAYLLTRNKKIKGDIIGYSPQKELSYDVLHVSFSSSKYDCILPHSFINGRQVILSNAYGIPFTFLKLNEQNPNDKYMAESIENINKPLELLNMKLSGYLNPVKLFEPPGYLNNVYYIKIAPNYGSRNFSLFTSAEEEMVKDLLTILARDIDLVKSSASIVAYGSITDNYGNSKNVKTLKCFYSSQTISRINPDGDFNVKQIADRWESFR